MCWFFTILPLKEKTINPTASVALIIIWRIHLNHLIWKKTKCDQNKVFLDQSLLSYHNSLVFSHSWAYSSNIRRYISNILKQHFSFLQKCRNLLERHHTTFSLSLYFSHYPDKRATRWSRTHEPRYKTDTRQWPAGSLWRTEVCSCGSLQPKRQRASEPAAHPSPRWEAHERTDGCCSPGARLKAWQTQTMVLLRDNMSSTVSGSTRVPFGSASYSGELVYSSYF